MAEGGIVVEASAVLGKPLVLNQTRGETSKLPETQPSLPEIKQELPVAEDVARIRTDLEQKILVEGLPATEWIKTCDQELKKYPGAKPYRNIFHTVVERAVSANTELEIFWQTQHGDLKPVKNDTTAAPQANPIVVRQLFKSIFGFDLKEDAEVFMSPINLRFVLGDEDFRALTYLTHKNEKRWEGGELPNGFMTGIPGHNFSATVMRKNIQSDPPFYVTIHELEHAKNRVLNLGKIDALATKLEIPERELQIFNIRLSKDSIIDAHGKDELLACFTLVEMIDPDQPTPYNLMEILQEFGRGTSVTLTDQNGVYYPWYVKTLNPTEEEKKEYLKNIPAGMNALFQLFDLYHNEGMRFGTSARMSINVLEQFPLREWPAVVRLIKARHTQKNR